MTTRPTSPASDDLEADPTTTDRASTVRVRQPGFRQPPAEATPRADPLDPAATTITPPTDEDPGWLSDGDDGELGSETGSTSETRSRASTEPPAELVTTIAQLTTLFVRLASVVPTRLRLARGIPNEAAAEWLATDEEADAIGIPLARILARRVPSTVEQATSPDFVDGLEAAVAVAGYAGTNFVDERAVLEQIVREQGGAPTGDGT